VGAVACLLLLSACSHLITVDSPALTGSAAADCRALIEALPRHVDNLPRRVVHPAGGYAAAWGDPPIVLTCGVPRPKGLDRFASCIWVNGVGWFIPDSQASGTGEHVDMTTIGRKEFVTVSVPSRYFPPAATMADLAAPVKKAIPEVRACQ
jgi:hypothetical protein